MTYYGGRALADSFRTVRRNTLVIAEEIPEDRYGFRATPETRSVAEMLSHIAVQTAVNHEAHAVDRVRSFVGVDFGALLRQWGERERRVRTKAQIVNALRADGDAWAGWLDQASEEVLAEQVTFPAPVTPTSRSRFELILSVKEHEMHHRAPLMLMQRLLGLVPHLTRRHESPAPPAPARGDAR